MKDICCIGHITRDKIIIPGQETYAFGGTSYYFVHALRHIADADFSLVTSLGESDYEVIDEMKELGVDVTVYPSRNTVFFENKYGENMNNRTQRVLSKADPFSVECLKGIDAKYLHIGSLLADDFSPELIKEASKNSILSVDAQGFLRYVDGEKVYPCDWTDKEDIFPYIDILKVNECEIEALTGYSDSVEAGKKIASWGVKEVLITLGSYGSVIYSAEETVKVPAFKPKAIVDATGCGDTYAAGYLYMRSKGASRYDSGVFAAAMSSLKLEHTGPCNASREEIEEFIRTAEIVKD